MPKQAPPAARPRNRLLARLPEAEYRRLLPLLQPVRLPDRTNLYEPRGAIDYAYFPCGAVVSALTVMRDGNVIEVATIGNEGLVGHYGIGGQTSPHRVVVQVGDGAHRIASHALHEETVKDGPGRREAPSAAARRASKPTTGRPPREEPARRQRIRKGADRVNGRERGPPYPLIGPSVTSVRLPAPAGGEATARKSTN